MRYDRRHTTPRKSDPLETRSAAQKDRDRVLYTSAFRRLAEVTQVVAADTGHVFHNRLTHSLQVAQVGRRMAERLQSQAAVLSGQPDCLNPDVVEAACLIHDLGHPPFGHIAEDKLNELAGDEIDGFEGNAQSFRIVTRLSQHSPMHRGLDLTRATLSAVLKYPWYKGQNEHKLKKWGAYHSEAKDFEFAAALLPNEKTPTLEASLMDWADDITYSVHDLEDFYRAGRIPLHLLADRRYDKERRSFFELAFDRHPEKEGSWSDHRALEEAFNQVIVGLFPLERSYSGTWQERAKLRDFSSELIGRYVGAIAPKLVGSNAALEIDSARQLEVAMLKELTWVYVIQVPSLATQQEGQREVIGTLFKFYSEAAENARSKSIFTPYYRSALEDAATKGEKRRVIIDLIAGMTEAQAVAMHNRLLGIVGGFGLDDLLS